MKRHTLVAAYAAATANSVVDLFIPPNGGQIHAWLGRAAGTADLLSQGRETSWSQGELGTRETGVGALPPARIDGGIDRAAAGRRTTCWPELR